MCIVGQDNAEITPGRLLRECSPRRAPDQVAWNGGETLARPNVDHFSGLSFKGVVSTDAEAGNSAAG